MAKSITRNVILPKKLYHSLKSLSDYLATNESALIRQAIIYFLHANKELVSQLKELKKQDII